MEMTPASCPCARGSRLRTGAAASSSIFIATPFFAMIPPGVYCAGTQVANAAFAVAIQLTAIPFIVIVRGRTVLSYP